MQNDAKKQPIKYDLKELTPEVISNTKKAWERDSSDLGAFEIENGFLFDIISSYIDYDTDSSNKSVFYGIFKEEDSGYAEAFVELIVAQRGQKGMTKMMKLWSSPKYWDVDSYRNELAHIYITAIIETMQKGFRDSHKLVKIYARNDYIMTILNVIYNHLSEKAREGTIASIVPRFEGRWLVIESV